VGQDRRAEVHRGTATGDALAAALTTAAQLLTDRRTDLAALAGDEIPAPDYAGDGVRADPSRERSAERAAATGQTTTTAPSRWLLAAMGVGVVGVLAFLVVVVRRRVRR
jgi:hypothetical protein